MKILVIRFSSLGDVVLTGPVLVALRQAYPEAHLAVAVKAAFAEALANHPAVNEILSLAPGDSLISFIRRIRRERFDLLVDLHSNFRSRLISFFARAGKILRYRKAALARRLFVRWRVSSGELQRHTLDRYMDTLRPLGIEVESATPPSILLIQTAFLGDAVLTTPMLDALRAKYPSSAITVLCTPEIADVFRTHPAKVDLILFDKRGKERTLRSQWSLARSLRTIHFDLAIIPHRSLTSALLARVAGVPRRIGFSKSQGRWFMTDTVPFRWGVHDVDRNLSLLQPLGILQPSARLWIQSNPDTQKQVMERLQLAGVSAQDRVLGINAGSIWPTKRWLPEGFASVADRAIRDLGMKVVFIGGAKDAPVMVDILRLMKEHPLNWVGQTSLGELMALIARCQVFLTNDSGPMHIAVASRVPTVALFGPTTRELGFFPYGEGHTVVEKDLPCRPCGLHGSKACPLGHFRCMKEITVEEVLGAVKSKLLVPADLS